ncbi:MAG: glycosyltransferase family 4 protein [Proteobacteria bacterium]|nr:glycosyltransferase family 4 protein [Pseudomonadota bacterium]
MNILYDHQAISMQRYGGISRYFYEVSNRIAAIDGTHVEMFSPLYVNSYFKSNGLFRPVGIYVPYISKSLRIIRTINNFVSLRLRQRYDVDIFHETYYSLTERSPRSAKKIITVYDMIHEKYSTSFKKDDQTQKIKDQAIKRADHVICISENTRKDLIELLDIPLKKTSVVHLGYSLTMKGYSEKAVMYEKPYILYVGQRNGYKNFERFIRAYASSRLLKNKFTLIFFGGTEFSVKECEIMKKLSLSSNHAIQLSGDDGILASLYLHASAFVYPSLYEGFGIPPLEAMSFGCPVICSNTSSIPEVVGDAAELFDPMDEDDMRGAMERVLCSPERATLLVKLGFEHCKKFSWEKCAKETLEVYKKVLRG